MTETTQSALPISGTGRHSIGLALGGGGARGLAHIVMLEAFDELGLKPDVIAGSSMGALVAAAYASGIPALEIRKHALDALKSRTEIARRLFGGRAGDIFKLIEISPRVPALVDGARLIELFLPAGVADDFAKLEIPLIVVATDYYARKERLFENGALRPALAASIALPGIMTPRVVERRVMIDGSIVNPLPFDKLVPHADHIVAIDVTGGPAGVSHKIPNNIDLLFRTNQIMQHQIVEAKLQAMPVDIIIRPDVGDFRVLEFHKVRQILKAAEPAKDELKQALENLTARITP